MTRGARNSTLNANDSAPRNAQTRQRARGKPRLSRKEREGARSPSISTRLGESSPEGRYGYFDLTGFFEPASRACALPL